MNSRLLLDIGSAFVRATANTFTLIIFGLVIILSFFGKNSDATFLASTITITVIVAIIQEVRAKQALYKLELFSTAKAQVIREDKTVSVPFTELQVGDHVFLESGDQIPADGQVIDVNNLFINQALLTGEAREIAIHLHNLVYAGSFVVAGTGVIRVTAIGSFTRAGQMTAKLRWYQNKLTPLQRSISRVIRFLTYIAILLGILIYVEGRRANLELAYIASSIANGALSVVPEGLLLASTLLYSYGAIKLIKEKVLLQRVAAVEGFSRLTTLCLDKTGTLTSNLLQVKEIRPFPDYDLETAKSYIGVLLEADRARNSTNKALHKAVPTSHLVVHEAMPFTSSRKYSAALFQDGSERRVVAMGAPEILSNDSNLTASEIRELKHQMQHGYRVLLLMDYGPTIDVITAGMKRRGKAVAMIMLKPTIRPDAEDTIFYLQAQGVNLKIISGDSTETIQAIAKEVGLLNRQKTLSGDQLAALSPKEWRTRIPETTIFSRVLPEQKERIIKTLQKGGFVGMVGDGVNDTLALKQADLSIAMAEGSQAARQVADVVLLTNTFSSVPKGMRLGSQIILGLEMVTCLFFNKIVTSSTILLLSLLFGATFPFTTRYLLLLNLFTVGMPTLMWSLVPAEAAKRLSSEGFIRRVTKFTVPNGVISGLAALVGFSMTSQIYPGNIELASTSAFFITLFLGIVTVWLIPRVCGAVQNYNTRWWPWIYSGAAFIMIAFSSQVNFISDFFELQKLNWLVWIYTVLITLLASSIIWIIAHPKKHYVVGESAI